MEVRRIRESGGWMYPYQTGIDVIRCCLHTKSLHFFFDRVKRPPRTQEELVQSIHSSIQANLQPIAGYWGSTYSAGIHKPPSKVLRFIQGNISTFLCYPQDREPEFVRTEPFR